MTYFQRMKMESLFFVANCWSLLIMNCGLVQNRDSIFIIFEWVNMFIWRSSINDPYSLSDNAIIPCVRIERVVSGLDLILEV